jgi:iron complex outermembrane recepter protein
VTWKLSEKTQNTFYLEYLNSHDPVDSGLPVIGGRLPPVPVEETVEDGGEVHTTDLRVGARGSHVFDDGWTERHYLDARWVTTPQSPQLALAADGLSPSNCTPGGCPVERQLLSIPDARGSTYYGALNFTRDAGIWGTRHSLLIGVDFMQAAQHEEFWLEDEPSYAIDLFNPQHQPVPPGLAQGPPSFSVASERWGGVYFQDQVALGEKLRLLGGARFDDAVERKNFSAPHETALTGRAGLVWLLTPAVSAYMNYTEGFGVSSGLYALGSGGYPTAGASSKEWEGGLKIELLEGRVGGSAAWFELTKSDLGSPVQLPVLTSFPLVVGTVRNRGLELDLHGEILPGLQLLANGAYTDSRILNEDVADFEQFL